ncbi:MAG: hypothetical protein C0448_01385 [Sphingobacteriaceae bacterium]|nr:hypothetical protein [Sphingobacteriaceae bacterium]
MRLFYPIISIFIFIVLGVDNLNSQSLVSYTASRSTGVTYASINITGNAFDSWRNTTSFTQDDNRSDFTDIGFDFWFNGVRYTQFSVSTNGFIDFSTSTDDGGPIGDDFGYVNSAFTSNIVTNSTNPAIAPFYDDLMAQGGTSALGNSIKYALTGAAPNRTLTVEWINMAVYGNTSPSLNFQVKLVESSGIVLINYGTMNTGTQVFSYSMGLNGQILNAPPTAAQLKELQTVNTNVFSNAIQNNLSAMPAANSQYIFTPPVPTVASGIVSFSTVTQTGMTINWPNWATNEIGYVLYNSTDNLNFNFVSQTAANAVSYAVTGLLPSTTYYWRVYAVTEGCLSSALTGSQTTLSGGNKISITSGMWNTATTWSPTGVPSTADNVTIANGHTVTINANSSCNNLTVGQGISGILSIGNNNTARVITVNGNVTINSGATFSVNPASNITHSITIPGDIINNGRLNFVSDALSLCNATFTKNGNQTISGSGGLTSFNIMTLNMGSSVNNILDIQTPSFTAPNDFLKLNFGTFKLSTSGASTITPYTIAATIPQKGGIWLNSASSTINNLATLTMYGNVTVSNGVFNVGNAVNEDLLSNGGYLTISGGTLNIASKYYAVGINNLSKFTISGGNVIVPSIGSTNTAIAPFQIAGAGSQFNMSGGSLIIPREGGTGAQNLGFVNTGTSGGSVTGGTLQIGSSTSPAAQIIQINTTFSIGNLLVNSANVNTSLLTNSLNVINDVAINTGTLTANNLGISLGKNWTNNGGLFVPGSNTVNFVGTTAQTIFKLGGETFNNISFSNAGTKTLLSAITASNVVVNSGSNLDVNTTNNQITVRGNFTNSGSFNARRGLVFLNGTVAQSIGGVSITDFYNLTLNNNAGANITNAENLIGTLTLNNGTFNTNAQVFTMVSTATNTARIAQITGTGDIIGNVKVQRYAPGGYTGWALLGTPISSALTLQDWDDDMPISCSSCPDGSAAGFLSIYHYDETAVGSYSAASAYIPLSSITNPIIPNRGYWVYLGTGFTNTSPITIDVTGTVRKFNNSIPLTKTNTGSVSDDGWNLIHNPYPSAISWSALRNGNPNIDNAIYGFNADLNGGLGSSVAYVNGISSPAIGAGGISDTIPMCQGFQVHCTASATLTAQESNKIAGNPTFLKMNQSAQVATTQQLLRLYLDGPSSLRDEAVLYIQPGATNNFDVEYDAIKLAGQDPSTSMISMLNGMDEFQINGISPITSSYSVAVKTTTGVNGTYTISLANFNSFPTGACISLYDSFNGTTTDLKISNYVFNLNTSATNARFILNITINPLDITTNASQPNCITPNNGEITAIGNNSGPWNYFWKDGNGSSIKTSLNKSTADTISNLNGGNYTLEINTVGQCDNRDSVFTIVPVEIVSAQFSSIDTTYLSSGANIIFNNNSTNAVNTNWNFGDGVGFSSSYSPSYNYLAAGIYTVSLIATSNSGCLDTAYKSVVVIADVTGLSAQNIIGSLMLKTLDQNEFLLEGIVNEESNLDFKLYDALGKLIKDFGNFNSEEIHLPLNLKEYKVGVYYLNIIGTKNNKTIKLLVK